MYASGTNVALEIASIHQLFKVKNHTIIHFGNAAVVLFSVIKTIKLIHLILMEDSILMRCMINE